MFATPWCHFIRALTACQFVIRRDFRAGYSVGVCLELVISFSRQFLRTIRPLLGNEAQPSDKFLLSWYVSVKSLKRVTMSQFNGTHGKGFDHHPLERLRQYVDERYAEHIFLSDAAQISGLQMSSFCSFFRTSVGINFTDWLRQVRISRAIELMKTSALPITRIAHDVGFVEMITFEREFKKHTRMTPRDFKESLRPN